MKRIDKKANIYKYEKEVISKETVEVDVSSLDSTIEKLKKVVDDLKEKYDSKKAELDFYEAVKEDVTNG